MPVERKTIPLRRTLVVQLIVQLVASQRLKLSTTAGLLTKECSQCLNVSPHNGLSQSGHVLNLGKKVEPWR